MMTNFETRVGMAARKRGTCPPLKKIPRAPMTVGYLKSTPIENLTSPYKI